MKLTLFSLFVAGALAISCTASKLHLHAKKIDAVQLVLSPVLSKPRFLQAPTLDMDLLEAMAAEPSYAIGEARQLETQMSQPRLLQQSLTRHLNETIKAFPLGKSDYALDVRISLVGFVEVQDEGGGFFFAIVNSSLTSSSSGRIWSGRVIGISPKTSFSAVVNGEFSPKQGLDLALSDASLKIDSMLESDAAPPES